MQRYFYWALILLAVCQANADEVKTNAWGAITNGAQLSISVKGDQSATRSNQPVSLMVRVRNASTNKTFNFSRALAIEKSGEISVKVISPSGKNISPVPLKGFVGSSIEVVLRPNQTNTIEFNLSSVCKLEEIGTYTIIAETGIYEREEKMWFKAISNSLNLSVISDSAK